MNSSLPLVHKRIVVTRAEEQSETVSALLGTLGARVIVVPTIRIEPVELSPEELARISRFFEYDVIIFTSYNCVRNFFRRVSVEASFGKKPVVVAIGKKTADALVREKFAPDIVPVRFNSSSLIHEIEEVDWHGKRVLIPAGNLSGAELREFVESSGGIADVIVVYRTVVNDNLDPALKGEITAGRFDTIAFFSPSQVRNFVSIFGPSVLSGKQIAAIGPTTKSAVENIGLHVDVVPGNATTEDLIASLIDNEKAG